MSETNKLKSERLLIELRREKVLELLAQGLQQNQIAQKLGVSKATISIDLQFLKSRAEDNLRRHIQESLPLQYDKAMSALTQVVSKVWNIAENTHDERTRLQAYSMFTDCHKYIMDMSASSPRITNALKYVSDLESKKLEQEQGQVPVQEQQQQEQEEPSPPIQEQDPMQEQSEDE
jgi:predicted transcriptional regulator